MKINANELLLLNKKVRFGEEAGKPAQPQIIEQPTTQETNPQAGMNALMFQGMNNVVSNPQLATNLSVMREEVAEEGQQTVKNDTQDEASPLKTNVAFQGKASRFKNVAMSALMGLMTLGAASALQSCQPDVNVSQSVDIDMTAITEMIAQMQALMQQMKEQQEITNSQLQTMNAYLLQLMQEVKNGNINQEQFYQKMYAYMIQNESNQEIIIQQLVNNGKSQDEANKLIQDLIAKVDAGIISAQQAMETIQNLLGDIKGLLGQVLSSLTKAENDRAELIELAKQGNANTSTLIDKADVFIESSNTANAKLDEIKSSIEKANMDSNANFDAVVKTLNMNKDQLIGVMMKLGYTQAKIQKMTAGQIIAAIKENTQVTKNNNATLNEILAEVKSGKLSAEEASKKIINLLENIQKSLDQVIVSIKDHYHNDANVTVYLQKIQELLEKNNDKTDSTNEILNNIYNLVETNGTKADDMGKQILNYIAAVGFEMNRNFGKLIEEVQTGNGKLDYMTELMVALNKQVKQNGEDGKKLGNEILNYLGAVGFEMNRNFTAVLGAINNGTAKLGDIEKLVAQLNTLVKENNENNQKLGNQIINYLGKLGTDMNKDFTAILNAINKGNAGTDKLQDLLEKVLEKQDQNMNKIDTNCKAIIEAMGNIKVDGGKIDLSSIEAMLKDLLAQSKKNGNTLSSINGKLDVIQLTQQAILDKINAEAHKGDERYTETKALLKEILDKVGKQNGKYDDGELLKVLNNLSNLIDTKLDAILKAIKDHDVKVTVDVTGKVKCECNCGKKDEGIIGDLANALN
ncbi:hypothetical protein EGQ24_00695 [bacterium]|nr:hypothetical protein [bacterium]